MTAEVIGKCNKHGVSLAVCECFLKKEKTMTSKITLTADEAKQALKEGKRVWPIDWDIKIVSLKEDDYQRLMNFPKSAVFEIFKDDEWEVVE